MQFLVHVFRVLVSAPSFETVVVAKQNARIALRRFKRPELGYMYRRCCCPSLTISENVNTKVCGAIIIAFESWSSVLCYV